MMYSTPFSVLSSSPPDEQAPTHELLRDRDYLLDQQGNFLKVVGDYHPCGQVISYVKYFPSEYGSRKIGCQTVGYNSFVSKSFVILSHQANRVCFSSFHGGIVPCTPVVHIRTVFSCRKKLQEILRDQERYLAHPVGNILVRFLSAIQKSVHLEQVGITGSFLLDGYTNHSDIDLVCYGHQAYQEMQQVFDTYEGLRSYHDPELAQALYTRRMIHMAPMDFDLLLLQETRKFQAVSQYAPIHINCQPLRDERQNWFADLQLMELGEISCIAEIRDDEEGRFSPAYYEIQVLDILDSLFSGSQMIKQDIRAFISFIGVYSNTFRVGDRVFLQGKLVQIQKGSHLFYGVELTPWNTSRTFVASLLHPQSC